jgi:DNA-binding NarL/FixJ family response regulator
MKSLSIGIIDDHALFRAGIQEIIHAYSPHKVTISVESPNELYEALESHVIQVLLLDIKLKKANGIEVFRLLKKSYSQIKVIVLTMHEESVFVHSLVKEGVHGFLLKDTPPKELLETIDNVYVMGKYFDQRTANILVEKIQSVSQIIEDDFEISDIEIAVLKFISDGKTSVEIGELLFKSRRTIEGYKQRLMRDTKSNNVVELITWAYKKNLIQK